MSSEERTADRMGLSETEIEVLQCAADGMSVQETAAHRRVSIGTTKTQRASVLLRLQATTMAHAVAIGFRRELIA